MEGIEKVIWDYHTVIFISYSIKFQLISFVTPVARICPDIVIVSGLLYWFYDTLYVYLRFAPDNYNYNKKLI